VQFCWLDQSWELLETTGKNLPNHTTNMLFNTFACFLVSTTSLTLVSATASHAITIDPAHLHFADPQLNSMMFDVEKLLTIQPARQYQMGKMSTMGSLRGEEYFPGSEEMADHDEGCYLTSKPRMTCQASACDHICIKRNGRCVIGTRGKMFGCGSCKCAS
jgi:hypothetical protein